MNLPPAWLVLVNPGVAVSTPAIFKRLTRKDNPPLTGDLAWADAVQLARWLDQQRNDLMPPAVALEPVIGHVIAALTAQPDCLIARMSGSGATCFGLFAGEGPAQAAAAALRRAWPAWWVQPAAIAP